MGDDELDEGVANESETLPVSEEVSGVVHDVSPGSTSSIQPPMSGTPFSQGGLLCTL